MVSGCQGQSPASWEEQPGQFKERSWISQAGLPGGGKEPKAPSPKALHTPGVGAGLPAEFLWWEDPCCEWGSAAPPGPWAPRPEFLWGRGRLTPWGSGTAQCPQAGPCRAAPAG